MPFDILLQLKSKVFNLSFNGIKFGSKNEFRKFEFF